MTLRVLQYRAYCAMAEEVEYQRAQAQRELDGLVRDELQDAVTWQEFHDKAMGAWVISWSIRMDDDDILQPLDD